MLVLKDKYKMWENYRISLTNSPVPSQSINLELQYKLYLMGKVHFLGSETDYYCVRVDYKEEPTIIGIELKF